MRRIDGGLLLVVLLAGTTACASVAPKHVLVPENINKLRDGALTPARVGEFTAAREDLERLTIRGGQYASPYQGSFAKYVEEALRQDLADARLLDPASAIEVAGVLTRNELDTGMAKGTAQIEAQFLVRRDGGVVFDKVKAASLVWDSSFVGAIAIPKSQQNYPIVVQRLLSELYADPDFLTALEKK